MAQILNATGAWLSAGGVITTRFTTLLVVGLNLSIQAIRHQCSSMIMEMELLK